MEGLGVIPWEIDTKTYKPFEHTGDSIVNAIQSAPPDNIANMKHYEDYMSKDAYWQSVINHLHDGTLTGVDKKDALIIKESADCQIQNKF